jgi:acyl-CoA synthetase (AMP-forming)/AMP-acid ligase II
MLTSTSVRLILGNLAAWSHGSAIVYPSEIYNPRAIVEAVINERCTALHGVPTHFMGVLAEVERRQQDGENLDFSRLRFVSCSRGTAFHDHTSVGQELPPVRPSQ